MNRGAQSLSIMVVPDSGTGELTGLSGTLSINIIDGKHFYDFIYSHPRTGAAEGDGLIRDNIEHGAFVMSTHQQLAELLAHPSVWRGRSRAAVETLPTGFAALDAGLPGGGWPRHGLVEILTPRPGVGELYLLLPALAALSRVSPARWCTWVSPPHEPFAPALRRMARCSTACSS